MPVAVKTSTEVWAERRRRVAELRARRGFVRQLLDFYGDDVILLIGGGLFQHSADLLENCREFRKAVRRRNPGVRIQNPE